MVQIVSIVEGDEEVQALPVLLRRLNAWLTANVYTTIQPPIRVHRDRFIRHQEDFERILRLATKKSLDDGWILNLLDADDDCPVSLAAKLLEKARCMIPHRSISVVLANREFEGSLRSRRPRRSRAVLRRLPRLSAARPRRAATCAASRAQSSVSTFGCAAGALARGAWVTASCLCATGAATGAAGSSDGETGTPMPRAMAADGVSGRFDGRPLCACYAMRFACSISQGFDSAIVRGAASLTCASRSSSAASLFEPNTDENTSPLAYGFAGAACLAAAAAAA